MTQRRLQRSGLIGACRRGMLGGIALMSILLVPVLFGFGALVVDIGRMYVFKTEVQNAMDSCALAASSSLTGVNDPNIFDVARAHGLATMDATRVGLAARNDISVNRLHFQRDDFNLASVDVEFSTALTGAAWIEATSASFAGITPQTAKFVRCTYSDAGNALFFAPIVRALAPSTSSAPITVAATAAAALRPAQSSCAIPVAVCKTAGGTAATNWGRTIGERMTAVTSPGASYASGAFGWLDFSPPAGGAPELEALMAGSGSCAISIGTPVGQPGGIASLTEAWNTRFGIYRTGGGGTLTTGTSPPDFTGWSYPAGGNNYADYVGRVAARTAHQGTVSGPNSKLTTAQHGTLGQKRRIATAVVVDCTLLGGGSYPPVLDFACLLLLAPVRNGGAPGGWSAVSNTMDVEFLGRASVAGTPCATSGLAGGAFGPPVPTLMQ